VVGALFVPLFALALLAMNGRAEWVGREMKNGWLGRAALVLTLLFFVYLGWQRL
jgi:hypothetical protein